ncbi:uncharacterized protein RAG0_03100 [Rhynchosporium agropyri]|uniref:GTP cyclohydrolase 1 n=1 Tax=Rhynchosporium agropyri TaxID=914238 RepID=A0A1E1K301_9HELO|nr:uncharacterized protein RAG0_03100 [Rhynchosporium agropyri]
MFSRRLQVQERLIKQVSHAFFESLQTQGVGVVIESSHLCMVMRGVEKTGAITTTSHMLRVFQSHCNFEANRSLLQTIIASLESLKQEFKTTFASSKQQLSNEQYSEGFDLLVRGSGWTTYHDFIILQLNQLLTSFLNTRAQISALEIGPGPKSVLGILPETLKHEIKRYTAFEPNGLFARDLERWMDTKLPFPNLEEPPNVHNVPFTLQDDMENGADTNTMKRIETYDIVLFCHRGHMVGRLWFFIVRELCVSTA